MGEVKEMPRYVCTAKVGTDGISVVIRDTETGEVASFTVIPKDVGERFVKAVLKPPEFEVKWE